MNTLFYPPSIDWELTSVCNHNCIHCYNYWRKQNNIITCEKGSNYYIICAEKIIRAKPVSVQITGGEPLIMWDKVKPAIERLLDAGICVSINTNATLATREISKFLSENKIDAFVSFPCSRPEVFDRIVNCPGAHSRALRGIQTMIDEGVRVSLNMVVTKLNFPYVYETAQYVHEKLHLSYFSATKASFPQNADKEFRAQMLTLVEFNEMLDVLLRVKEVLGMRVDSAWVYSLCGFSGWDKIRQFGFNRRCSCGKYSFVIDAEGNIKACGCDSQSFGNILDESFSEAIAKMTQWQDGSLLPEKCKYCSALKDCGGGCRSDACSANGNYCALDSTADPDKIDPKVPGDVASDDVRDGVFTCPGEVCFVEENGFVRISYRTNYEFVSYQTASFLRHSPNFTVEELCQVTLQPHYIVQQWVNKMCSKKLLAISSEQVSNICEITDKGFPLSATPYVDQDVPPFVKDYASADHNSKRFV